MNRPFATLRATTARPAYAAVGGLAILAAGLAAPNAGQAAPAPPAQLSISLTDGVTQVHSNTDVNYVTKVTNNGSSPISAQLVLSTPAYVTITKAAGGKFAAHSATWRITVRPGRSVSKPATARIGVIAKGEYRVTTLASLYRGKTAAGIPLIRTAVANRIAGVTDPAGTVQAPPPHRAGTKGSSGTNWLLVAGLPGLGIVLLGGILLWWRRRRTGREASSPAEAGIELPAPSVVAAPAEPVAPPATMAAEPPAEPPAEPVAAPAPPVWSKRPRPTPVAAGRHHAEESE